MSAPAPISLKGRSGYWRGSAESGTPYAVQTNQHMPLSWVILKAKTLLERQHGCGQEFHSRLVSLNANPSEKFVSDRYRDL